MTSSDTAQIMLRVDGRSVRCNAGVTVAVAVLNAGVTQFRTSVTGSARGPLCGMGTCAECRVTIDGNPHQRACVVPAREGMDVKTRD
jgi:sarcosine oxidase subunit alpha